MAEHQTADEPLTRRNRSSEELRMRDLVVPELRKRWPGARIIHELGLRYSSNRIDLAAVTDSEIIAVEIKSSKDVADRLERQLRAFAPIASRIIVGLAPKWNEKLPMLKQPGRRGGTAYVHQYTEAQAIIRRVQECHRSIDTWTVDAETGLIKETDTRWSRNEHPWPAKMLDMLHVSELADIANRHRVYTPDRRATHKQLVDACAQLMTGREVAEAVCRALRERGAFAAESDEPLTLAEAGER